MQNFNFIELAQLINYKLLGNVHSLLSYHDANDSAEKKLSAQLNIRFEKYLFINFTGHDSPVTLCEAQSSDERIIHCELCNQHKKLNVANFLQSKFIDHKLFTFPP